jgi:Sec7-like guanine-nucleotide exchange factor
MVVFFWLHRDHPVAERLDLDSLTPEQMNALQEVIKLFNQKPKKGIAHLIEQKLVVDKPEAIAHFLLTTPKLDAALVGEYISEPYASSLLTSLPPSLPFGSSCVWLGV